MGNILNAVCRKCGFEREFQFGGGMQDFTTNCSMPAINRKTGKFVIENYYNKKELDKKYVFYNDPEMFESTKKCNEIDWDDIILRSKYNFCPKCKSFMMDFEFVGCFD